MTPDLIDKRHQMIQSWLNKVLADNVLGHSELVAHFLEEIKLDPEDDVLDENGNLSIKVDLGRMGYLWLLSNGVFKKRWFALRNNVLYKYHSHTVLLYFSFFPPFSLILSLPSFLSSFSFLPFQPLFSFHLFPIYSFARSLRFSCPLSFHPFCLSFF